MLTIKSVLILLLLWGFGIWYVGKETMLAATRKTVKHEEKEAGKILTAKSSQPNDGIDTPEMRKAKIR